MNDLLTINFFKNNSDHKRIDFQEVLAFFEEIPNFQIFYTEDVVEIEYSDKEFGLKYSYLITKKSRVDQIYKLNPSFSNINFLLQFPIMIPSFLAKEIFALAQKLCKKFELGVYNKLFEDVSPFNLVNLVAFYEDQKKKCIEENGLVGRIAYEGSKLSDICAFQRQVEKLVEYYHNEVIVDLVYAIRQVDAEEGEEPIQGTCYSWQVGTPTLFPPHVDFINVKSDEEDFFVRKDLLVKVMDRKLIGITDFISDDMYILKAKQAKGSKKFVKKLLKNEIDAKFDKLPLLDCIEDR